MNRFVRGLMAGSLGANGARLLFAADGHTVLGLAFLVPSFLLILVDTFTGGDW